MIWWMRVVTKDLHKLDNTQSVLLNENLTKES
jgi:hypothetical protein